MTRCEKTMKKPYFLLQNEGFDTHRHTDHFLFQLFPVRCAILCKNFKKERKTPEGKFLDKLFSLERWFCRFLDNLFWLSEFRPFLSKLLNAECSKIYIYINIYRTCFTSVDTCLIHVSFKVLMSLQ